MPTDAEKYRILSRYLPSDIILDDKLTYCHINRAEQTQAIDKFRKALVEQNILIDQPSYLYKTECLLEPEWSGTFDFLDEGSERKAFTKPSIGWTCQPLECHIEGDLPVPAEKENEAVKEINKVEKCCVDIVHHHEDPIGPESHIHVVCKGVHPSDLGTHVNRLVKKVLKFRGHEVE